MSDQPAPAETDSAAAEPALVSFDHFAKLNLRTALVEKVENHPKADKLYLLTLKLGDGDDAETRQIVAGIKPYRTPEELEGKTIIIVANLEPAKIRGVESRGMLMAAGGKGGVPFGLLTVDSPVPPGTPIS